MLPAEYVVMFEFVTCIYEMLPPFPVEDVSAFSFHKV